jgi:hypothetical protein
MAAPEPAAGGDGPDAAHQDWLDDIEKHTKMVEEYEKTIQGGGDNTQDPKAPAPA